MSAVRTIITDLVDRRLAGGDLARGGESTVHDGTVGLYFMGFCREQAPMRERMESIYGISSWAADRILGTLAHS